MRGTVHPVYIFFFFCSLPWNDFLTNTIGETHSIRMYITISFHLPLPFIYAPFIFISQLPNHICTYVVSLWALYSRNALSMLTGLLTYFHIHMDETKHYYGHINLSVLYIFNSEINIFHIICVYLDVVFFCFFLYSTSLFDCEKREGKIASARYMTKHRQWMNKEFYSSKIFESAFGAFTFHLLKSMH